MQAPIHRAKSVFRPSAAGTVRCESYRRKQVASVLQSLARAGQEARLRASQTARTPRRKYPEGLPVPDEDPPFEGGVWIGWIKKDKNQLLDRRGKFLLGWKTPHGYINVGIMGRSFRVARLIALAVVWEGHSRR